MLSSDCDEKTKIEVLAQETTEVAKAVLVLPKPPILPKNKSLSINPVRMGDEKKHTMSKTKTLVSKEHTLVREFINIDSRTVEYYTGSNLRYYKEYKGFLVPKCHGVVSFPLENCDPLPLESAGDLKFFFTSAVEGSQVTPGTAARVIDPNISKVIAIRGKSESNGHWAQVYLGIDSNDFKLMGYKNSKKIYNAKIMAIQSKDTAHVETRCYFPPKNPMHGYAFSSEAPANACYLDITAIGLEVRKHLTNPKDCDWNNATFKKILAELFMKTPGVCLWHGCLVMQTCYWSKEENKLKGFKYKH